MQVISISTVYNVPVWVKSPPECTYMDVCVISVSQDDLDCSSCYVLLGSKGKFPLSFSVCVCVFLSLSLCKYQKGQKPRLHFPSPAKPAFPI